MKIEQIIFGYFIAKIFKFEKIIEKILLIMMFFINSSRIYLYIVDAYSLVHIYYIYYNESEEEIVFFFYIYILTFH